MNTQNDTYNKTATSDEQQLNLLKINQNLLAININLKSIADSLDKIAKKGIDTYNPCVTTNN